MRWLASLADPLQADTVVAVEEIARTDPTLSNPLSEIGEGAGSDVLGWTSYGVNRNGLGLEVGEVYGIYVDPDHWGAGIGADLLIDATRALCEAGFQRAILWVLAEDRLAREFYEARGWQDEGVSAPHESGANVVRYAKDLA
jgi:GNAT superfamily N-acetyltransferase